MSDEELPEIVVPNDDVAVRAQPPAARDRLPERAEKVWVVAALDDGSVVAMEIPRPEGITVTTERDLREQAPWYMHPYAAVTHEPGPWKLQVTVDGFDEDKHPASERPDALFSIRHYPPGAWKP